MKVIIKVSEENIETGNGIGEADLQTHIAANDQFASEAKILKAFLAFDFEAPRWPDEIEGLRLVDWTPGETDVLTYA